MDAILPSITNFSVCQLYVVSYAGGDSENLIFCVHAAAALMFAFGPFYASKQPRNLMDFPPIWNAYCNQVYNMLSTDAPLFDGRKSSALQPALLEETQP
jgi:hypothetical protein